MDREGPQLETLVRRLAETPQEFLDEPRIGASGYVSVPALVNDLMQMHGSRLPPALLKKFEGTSAASDRNRLALVMIGVWLLADEWLVGAGVPQPLLVKFFDETLAELAGATPAHKFVIDPDRREELTRLTLARLGYRPAGESAAQASDRLTSLSTTERKRLLEESRAAERRARAIREALAKKAAQESADKWSRE